MSLKTVNLNLVPVLRELLRTRSVSEAGRVLGRSPSAISEGLSQLRIFFGDPLLVRAQGGMTLTPRAVTLIDPVEALYVQAESVFQLGLPNPISTPRLITIAAHDYHTVTIGPRLVRMLEAAAPLMTLRFVDLTQEIGRQLTARDIDFALMPDFYVEALARARLEHASISVDRMVLLMREGHPLADCEKIEREHLLAYKHVCFQPNWQPADQGGVFRSTTRDFDIQVRVSQISAMPYFIAKGDFISTVPLELAVSTGVPLGLVYRPLAFELMSTPISICWSPVQNTDARHRWVREHVLKEMLREAPTTG